MGYIQYIKRASAPHTNIERHVPSGVVLGGTGSQRRDPMRRCLVLLAIPLAACADNAPGTSALVRDSAGVFYFMDCHLLFRTTANPACAM